MNRQLVLLGCFLSIVFFACLQAYAGVMGADRYALSVAQISPLISPLVSPLTNTLSSTAPSTAIVTATSSIALATTTNGSPVSLVLVAAVLVGLIAVSGLVIWRQR